MVDVLASESCLNSAMMNLEFGSWSCRSSTPGTISGPDQLDLTPTEWLLASVPGTVASSLASANQWNMNQPAAIDSLDWWYRTTFTVPEEGVLDHPCWVCFDGLATLAEIWLNGELLLKTDNMFRAYRLDITPSLRANNELVIAFRSVSENVQKKRPRPRWKTNLVNHQQLRWLRTTLLGRMPGWSPPVPTIGPWRAIRLEQPMVTISDVRLLSRLDDSTGVVNFNADLQSKLPVERVFLRVGTHECAIDVDETIGGIRLSGELRLPNVPLWWPHTHGKQPLFPCQLIVETARDQGLSRKCIPSADVTSPAIDDLTGQQHQINCGQIGFRQLHVERENGFSIELNGQPIYCRGACWTISDVFTLDGTEQSLRRDLTLVRDAGANMLRVIGTMIYESDLFYRLCDELGILVWQDFQFANMDYPVDDPSFADNIEAEAIDQLLRLSSHPSIVVYCGNSEVEQQAAMLGTPRELWRNEWFGERLPKLCAHYHPFAEYVPSTPTGGVLPFHPSSGISHFYGVGAYLRSPAELRQANVKFTPECLGFANIPEPDMVNMITEGALPVIHHPRWKQRVPRDTGAGWDFEDVRDHYVKHVYGLDPILLRSTDMPRYMELSRVVSGEMMAQTFSEWRGKHSQNRGGLVWFFKDLWPAAGWGIIDSAGLPKAAYYFLKRTWLNRQVTLTDEGLNGLHIHIINEAAERMSGFVEITLLKEPNITIARSESVIEIDERGSQVLSADSVLGGFYDVNYAYRFGPPHHDVVVATLFDADHRVVSEAFHFVRRRESAVVPATIESSIEMVGESEFQVSLQSDRFLHNVRVEAKGFLPDDNYFHLLPQRKKVIRCSALSDCPRKIRFEIEALNLETPVTVSKNRE